MNTNDIIRALFSNEIPVEDVESAFKLHEDFRRIALKLTMAGITVAASVANVDPVVQEVANRLLYHAPDIARFKAENKMERDSGSQWPFSNKISLIKNFRQKFGAGLANAKYAVEMLYEGHSNTL
jgi:ribosomal protein L7/L12